MLCWAAGLALCAIAAAIVVYMAVKGVQYLNFDLLTSRPQASADQARPAASWTRSSGRCC